MAPLFGAMGRWQAREQESAPGDCGAARKVEAVTPDKLNALVAEHVLAWKWDNSRCRICGWPFDRLGAPGCSPESCSMRPAPKIRADSPPDYLTWSGIGLIVEAMRGKGWVLQLEEEDGALGKGWRARFWKSAYTKNWNEVLAPDAPTAVAKAALKTSLTISTRDWGRL